MFISIALMCMEFHLATCTMMMWNDPFITEEACTANNDELLGQMGPQGIIVHTACFKVSGMGEPV